MFMRWVASLGLKGMNENEDEVLEGEIMIIDDVGGLWWLGVQGLMVR